MNLSDQLESLKPIIEDYVNPHVPPGTTKMDLQHYANRNLVRVLPYTRLTFPLTEEARELIIDTLHQLTDGYKNSRKKIVKGIALWEKQMLKENT